MGMQHQSPRVSGKVISKGYYATSVSAICNQLMQGELI